MLNKVTWYHSLVAATVIVIAIGGVVAYFAFQPEQPTQSHTYSASTATSRDGTDYFQLSCPELRDRINSNLNAISASYADTSKTQRSDFRMMAYFELYNIQGCR